jgi:hypothetical protein
MKYFLRSTNSKIQSQIQYDSLKESAITQQFVVTHATGQTEIPALLDFYQNVLSTNKNAYPYILVKM